MNMHQQSLFIDQVLVQLLQYLRTYNTHVDDTKHH